MPLRTFDLGELHTRTDAITVGAGKEMSETTRVCLHHAAAATPAKCSVHFRRQRTGQAVVGRAKLKWTPPTAQELACHADSNAAAERAACGVTVLLTGALTHYQVISRSQRGHFCDYWMGPSGEMPFGRRASRLEVSGILNGTDGQVRQRIKEKAKQLGKLKNKATWPGYVSVVEFSRFEVHYRRVL